MEEEEIWESDDDEGEEFPQEFEPPPGWYV